jgi:hypothetical protein
MTDGHQIVGYAGEDGEGEGEGEDGAETRIMSLMNTPMQIKELRTRETNRHGDSLHHRDMCALNPPVAFTSD